MKNKFEDILYFLTLWFSTSVIILFIGTLTFNACSSRQKYESKQTYTLESIPTYDSLGNVYNVKKEYNHKPTHEDSVEFEIESDKEIKKTMDSVFSIK